jgi:hypothetical protein
MFDPLGLIMCDPAWEPCNGVVYVDGVGSVSFAFGSFAGLAGLGLVNPVWHEPTYSGYWDPVNLDFDDISLDSEGYWSFDYINSNVQSMLVALSRGAANNCQAPFLCNTSGPVASVRAVPFNTTEEGA